MRWVQVGSSWVGFHEVPWLWQQAEAWKYTVAAACSEQASHLEHSLGGAAQPGPQEHVQYHFTLLRLLQFPRTQLRRVVARSISL